MINYKIVFSYDGSHFCGSQKQVGLKTVESELFNTLKNYFKDINSFVMASRTDRYVHANFQVANFFSKIKLNSETIINSINFKRLGFKIKSLDKVNEKFNARKSAHSREYIYLFSKDEIPVFFNNYISRIPINFNIDEFNNLLNQVIGTHDFRGFRKSGSFNMSTIRTIYHAKLVKSEYKLLTDSHKPIILYKVNIEGNSFLYQMIRNLIGSILHVLSNTNLNIDDFIQVIKQKKRIFNFKPAPPHGLYLNKITY